MLRLCPRIHRNRKGRTHERPFTDESTWRGIRIL